MEATKNSPAIILQRRPYRESDILITAYTLNFGKVSLVARGAKKLQSKMAGHLEPLTRADLMIVAGRGFDYVGGAVGLEAYVGIRRDLNKLYYAGRALGVFDHLVREDQTDSRLFSLLSDWLHLLNIETGDFTRMRGELFYGIFAWRFLSELGYAPQLRQCLRCGAELKPGNRFDLSSGGVLCADCYLTDKSTETGRELLPISDNAVKIMRFIIDRDPEEALKLKVSARDTKELLLLIDKFIVYHF